MSRVLKRNVYTADFETTSRANLDRDGYVRVWSWSLVNVESMHVWLGSCIESFLETVTRLKAKIVFFHNLRFDGTFIIDHLLKIGYPINEEKLVIDGDAKIFYAFNYGQTQFRDSLKKFGTSVRGVANFMGIDGKAPAPDFSRYIPEDYVETLEELKYVARDSYIIATAIEQEYDHGRMRLTASSETYHNATGVKGFSIYFPELPPNLDAFARRSYAGGVSYLKDGYSGLDLEDVYVYDENSAYPYAMHDRPLPIGLPYEDEPKSKYDLYIVDFYAEFELRDGYMPTIQVKGNWMYAGHETEWLKESQGITHLTMTNLDYDIFKRHYRVYNEFGHTYQCYLAKTGVLNEYLDSCYARKRACSRKVDGQYCDPYGREVAKKDLNMVYGAFGISPDRCNAYFERDPERGVRIMKVETTAHARYVPFASFVTSWGRVYLQECAQKNWKNFVYCDTDSMHLLAPAKGIRIHDTDLGAWALENEFVDGEPFPHAKYIRQKTYIHADENHQIYKKFNKKMDAWEYGVKCAGMPDEVKATVTWDNFDFGHEFTGKLMHCTVPGGVCLIPRKYQMGKII